MNKKNGNAPDLQDFAAFLEGKATTDKAALIYRSIERHEICREMAGFAVAALTAEKAGTLPELPLPEKQALRQKVRQLLQPSSYRQTAWKIIFEHLEEIINILDVNDGEMEVVAAAEDRGTLLFQAETADKESPLFWYAEVKIPTDLSSDLQILLKDAGGRLIKNGIFVFCGNKLDVTDGKTTITLEALRESLSDTTLEFHFADGRISCGRPAFMVETEDHDVMAQGSTGNCILCRKNFGVSQQAQWIRCPHCGTIHYNGETR